jgi:hypothetical protein
MRLGNENGIGSGNGIGEWELGWGVRIGAVEWELDGEWVWG